MDTKPPSNAAVALATITPPSVSVPDPDSSPLRVISPDALKALGQQLGTLFMSYATDRRILELRWLNNQRQYLGIYDPEVETMLQPNRSRAYPKVTRTKVISVVSRIMNLMFQGNEDNWSLNASPWPDITEIEVQEAMDDAAKADQLAGTETVVDLDYALAAVQRYAEKRSCVLKDLIRGQLAELGGSQASDYVSLNRQVLVSGVMYGPGVLYGPFAKEAESVTWRMVNGKLTPKKTKVYKPFFEFLSVWDFYPDLSAKTLDKMDGFFVRRVLTRNQLRELGDRGDFFKDVIDQFIAANPVGNYRPQTYEQDLRTMGIKTNVNEMKIETLKYEVMIWNGPLSGRMLQSVGCDVPEAKMARDIDAEIWMLDSNVIRAIINPWRELDVDVPMAHTFLYDEDDTSPMGQGLPNAMRDSQMMVSAATRMLLDNASVVCGPNLEVNMDLLSPSNDDQSISSYKTWRREGTGPDAQWPAVRNVQIDAHLDPLLKVVELGLKFADSETFVGPATGGDMDKSPSEPMRTAAGASMLRGDAALPFKDVIRSFDKFTMSVIHALVQFNRKLNPTLAPDGDYDVIARGATSLMAKEMRGMAADSLAQTLKPEEMLHVDGRKLVAARIKARDMDDILVTADEAARRKQAQDQAAAQQSDQQTKMLEAQVREMLASAFNKIAQAQKNTAMGDAATVNAALQLMEKGVQNAVSITQNAGQGTGTSGNPDPGQSDLGGGSPQGIAGPQTGTGQAQANGLPPAPTPGASG